MTIKESSQRTTAEKVTSGVFLVAVALGGILALLFFWNQLLKPGQLGFFGLPVVAFLAGLAATFNPCSLPVIPGFLTFMGGSAGDAKARTRVGLSMIVSLGAMTIVLLIGIIVAIVGSGTKELIRLYFHWVQLAVGLFLIGIATLHFLNRTSELPLVGPIIELGNRLWEGAMSGPTARSSYLFGAGYVLVGVG